MIVPGAALLFSCLARAMLGISRPDMSLELADECDRIEAHWADGDNTGELLATVIYRGDLGTASYAVYVGNVIDDSTLATFNPTLDKAKCAAENWLRE